MEKLDRIVVGLLLLSLGVVAIIGIRSAYFDSTPDPTGSGHAVSQRDHRHEGASTASLEERTYLSDVIVKVRLLGPPETTWLPSLFGNT